MSDKELALPSFQVSGKSSESFLDRWAHSVVMGLARNFRRNPFIMVFPDGSQRTFGATSWNGPIPHLFIRHPRFFRKVLLAGEIGFGEAYVEGLWATDDLPAMLSALILNFESIPGMADTKARSVSFNLLHGLNRLSHWKRRNTKSNSLRNISEHYDLSNDFYSLWLDETWTYSSARFEKGYQQDLRSAQEAKYRSLCENLKLQAGMKILEIGCGWGGFALYAARNFGVHVTAITISEAQYSQALERVRDSGLEDRIDVRIADYRDIRGKFDAIVSIEMIEAVGHDFLHSYFQQCHQLLNSAGRLGLQVILCPDSRYEKMRRSSDWIKKHIFPGGQLPSVRAILQAVNQTGDLSLQEMDSFGSDYAETLRRWRAKFNEKSQQVLQLGFPEDFLHKWNYYLCYCEAAFDTRNLTVSQLVFTRPNNLSF